MEFNAVIVKNRGTIFYEVGVVFTFILQSLTCFYKTVLRPVWTYGIELWGCTAASNIDIIQLYQSKMLRSITNAPWYVTNQALHQDLRIPFVRTIYRERIASHHTTLSTHQNPLMKLLLNQQNNRRLKRRWTFDESN
jgi:hypothetical protein